MKHLILFLLLSNSVAAQQLLFNPGLYEIQSGNTVKIDWIGTVHDDLRLPLDRYLFIDKNNPKNPKVSLKLYAQKDGNRRLLSDFPCYVGIDMLNHLYENLELKRGESAYFELFVQSDDPTEVYIYNISSKRTVVLLQKSASDSNKTPAKRPIMSIQPSKSAKSNNPYRKKEGTALNRTLRTTTNILKELL